MKVSLVCVAKNEHKYIKDWFEWHKKFGFDKIVCYNNSDHKPYNINDTLFEEIDVSEMEACQLKCYQDFINRMEFDSWCLFADVDEFLHCDCKGGTVHNYLMPYKHCDGVRLNWRVFSDCGQLHYDERPIWERNQIPSPKNCIYNDTLPQGVYEPFHVKTFYHKTFKPAQAQVHNILVAGGLFVNACGEHENGLSPFQNCDWNGAWLDHYEIKSTEEWCERRLNKIDATGNKIDNEKLIRWYFNLCARTKEKEEIINAYLNRNSKDIQPVSSECDSKRIQPLGESERPETDCGESKQTNGRLHKRVRAGEK